MHNMEMQEFYLTFKIEGIIHTGLFSGISLRHAKDKLMFQYSEATDIMDWTCENPSQLEEYISRQNAKHQLLETRLRYQAS